MSRSDITHELEPLFNPRSVAVIGATENWNKWGFSTFSSVLERFGGDVYPVNSRAESILGRKSFRRVTDIPEPVDLAVFVIPAAAIPSVMEDCAASGVKAGVIITAGFAETGEHGQKLQDEVVGAARKSGLRFVGPNCMGLWSASSNLMASMFPMLVEDGPLAFVSQGGNIGGAVVMSAYQRGVGFHRYVSCGCTADIQIEDYIEYFGDDPAGDRNFIAYLTAPPRILSLDQVDALIFMGLGNFSGFADMISSLGAAASRAPGPLLPSAEEIGRALAPFLGMLASGDPTQIGHTIGDALSRLGPLAGIGDETDSTHFSTMLADAIASGDIDVADLAQSLEAAAATVTTTRTLTGAIDAILGGLVRFWSRKYGKPVITTSFTEGMSRLQGKHFSYPSGRRASRTLVKLAEYGEYLDGQGISRERHGARTA